MSFFNQILPMAIERNKPLQHFNTFGIAAQADYFVAVSSEAELLDILHQWEGPTPFLLGGGSNLLLTQDVSGLVIKNEIRGKELQPHGDNEVLLVAGGGENWHELVLWSLEQGLGGLENLSLIPGTLGAAPIQNIGAYGVELESVFHHLEAIEIKTGARKRFSHADCRFAYRNSIFKNELKGQYMITRVGLRLTTHHHRIETSYGAIRHELDRHQITAPTPKDVSEAVIRIRSSKLPSPSELGNSGSFFKNPIVAVSKLKEIQRQHPAVPSYPVSESEVKVPAGWLIEQCGWKGKRVGDAGTYEKQALVLVNHGSATGQQLWSVAETIIEAVEEQFGIRLEPEVNVL
jgi:UDP-N-acetylmuramate dehydrogenase